MRRSCLLIIVSFLIGFVCIGIKADSNQSAVSSGVWIFAKYIATGDGVLKDKYVNIRSGAIQQIADALPSSDGEEIVIAGKTHILSPGFINCHDHIAYNHAGPSREALPQYVKENPDRYSQRNDWRKGCRGYKQIDAPGNKEPDVVVWNEMRQIVSGTTSVISSGGAKGFLRNFGSTPDLYEGLEGAVPVVCETFPLGDTDLTQPVTGDNYPKHPKKESFAGKVYVAHVAEGVDDCARNEYLNLSINDGQKVDILGKNVGLIHMIALLDGDIKKFARSGATIIWSPHSNFSLYGITPNVTALKKEKINIAIGSDWTYSGSTDVLEELNLAKRYNKAYLNSAFTNKELWQMATVNAAALLQMSGRLGDIKPGANADLVLIQLNSGDAEKVLTDEEVYGEIISASREKISLVARSGKILYGEKSLMKDIPGSWDSISFNKKEYLLAAVSETGKTYAQLAAVNAKFYPLYPERAKEIVPLDYPVRLKTQTPGATVFDGIPKPGDMDGDGIPDNQDNAPGIFNPIRPVDVTSGSGRQPEVR